MSTTSDRKRSFRENDVIGEESKKSKNELVHNREITTVLVDKLPKSYNQTKLKKFFQDCGKVLQLNVVDSINNLHRLARVEFESYENVLMALTKSHKKIGNNEIEVTLLENRTLWLTNFPHTYTPNEIKELFLTNGVAPLSIRLPSLRFNNNRRFAYVDVPTPEEARYIISILNGKVLGKYPLVVKLSNPLEKSKRTDAASLERREIIIRNLHASDVSEELLRETFSKYGEIEGMKMPCKTENGDNEGYAFITFTSNTDATKSLELHNTILKGNEISVILADSKAYLERQEVKRIISTKYHKNDNLMVCLYPLTDKISKEQVKALLKEKASVVNDEILKIYLVADHNGAIVVFKNQKIASKCIMALNHVNFQKKELHCGPVNDLKYQSSHEVQSNTAMRNNSGIHNNKYISANSTSRPNLDAETKQKQDSTTNKKMSNDDFRKMFFGN